MTNRPETLQPGNYWKTPFSWEPGCPMPPATSALNFEIAPDDWLLEAVVRVMASSLDESDRYAVKEMGQARVATELLALAPQHFEVRREWWRLARDKDGRRVGFVLTVLFTGEKTWRDGRREGTIYYMGVLPEFRGFGHGRELLAEATRICIAANCWRISCDTGTDNHPMVNAFRQAGYAERAPWQRSIK